MKQVNKNRLGSFHPRLETLENRWQPGSLLTKGVDLSALGSTLDQNVLKDNLTNSSLSQALDLNLGSLKSGSTKMVVGDAVSGTPYQVTHTNTTTNTSLTLSTGLPLGDQPASSHLGAVPSKSVTTGTSGVTIQNNQGPQTTQNNVTPAVAGAAPQAVALPAPTITPATLQYSPTPAGAGLQVTVQTADGNNGHHHPPNMANAATFADGQTVTGIAVNDTISNVSVSGTGTGATVVGAGTTIDPGDSTTLDGLVYLTNGSLSGPPTVAVISSTNGLGFNTQLSSVAQDSAGNIVVGGYTTAADGVTQNGFALNLTTGGSFSDSAQSIIQGVNLKGGSLYATGSQLNSSSGNVETLAAKSDAAITTLTYGVLFTFTQSGTRLVSTGLGVGGDSAGNSDIAGQAIDLSGNGLPYFAQINTGGTMINGGGAFQGANPADAFNTVSVNASDNAYYDGGLHRAGDQFAFDIVAGVKPDGNTLIYQSGGQGVAFLWELVDGSGNHAANWISYGNTADSAGNVIMETTFDNFTPGTFGQTIFGIDPTGGVANVNPFQDGLFGSNDDYGFGIAVDGAGNAWLAGKTNSPDFPTGSSTGTAFDTVYSGGTYDGWIAFETVP